MTDLLNALRKLTFAARTSGGVAGRDEALCAACDEAEQVIAASISTETIKALEQEAILSLNGINAGEPTVTLDAYLLLRLCTRALQAPA